MEIVPSLFENVCTEVGMAGKLTDCDLVTPYGTMDLSQYWLM